MPRLWFDPRAALAVAAGGCVGGPLRYAAGVWWPDDAGSWPWTTFAVNLIGAGVLAFLVDLVVAGFGGRHYLREFAGIGVLGAFTTFSTWMAQSHALVEADRAALAGLYLGGSLLAGLAAAVLGTAAARALTARYRPGDDRPAGATA